MNAPRKRAFYPGCNEFSSTIAVLPTEQGSNRRMLGQGKKKQKALLKLSFEFSLGVETGV